MKIENEYVEIKKGNKVYRKQNMILNTYLKEIFASQFNNQHDLARITDCYIKLDTPIENVNYDSELTRNDFDIYLYSSDNLTTNVITSGNAIKLIYNFVNKSFNYKKSDGTWGSAGETNFDIFSGRKITAIAFGMDVCYTFLDTNNMNIIINKGENFAFTRVDNIISDGIPKGIEYPLHLINDVAKKDLKWKEIDVGGRIIYVKETTRAKLYSIGFGNTMGYMEEEYLIDDVEVDRDNYSITFNVSRTKKVGHYPSENLQLGFYPTMDNSKYLIFKYKLYRRYKNDFSDQYVITDLDKYYTMSKLNDNFGNLEVKLKIERS